SRYSHEYPRDVPLLSAVRAVCGTHDRPRLRRDSRGQRGDLRHRRARPRRSTARGQQQQQEEEAGGRQVWFESLYQGAVFPLRRGDKLAATTTGDKFLDLHGAGQAYF
ncbi:TNFA factor, partial [Bucco capensis]|nr:TNFA factor [Bucco capensis]